MQLMQFQIDDIIKTALNEDINYIDVTTDLLVDMESRSCARYVAKDDGIVCGTKIAARVFEMLDSSAECRILVPDGQAVKKGDIIARLQASTWALLKGERTALNILQHMSGVATATNRLVRLVEGTKASIADTRKTLPGLRALEKYAVTVGGGKNHRYNLSDCAMLKDTHIDACGSITSAVERLRKKMGHTVKIEVEVSDFDGLNEALSLGVEIIMLDNMSVDDMAKAVKLVNGRAKLEASGNVTEERVRAIAETGVDIISVGAITHSVRAFDVSMKIDK